MKTETIALEVPADCNLILGQTHFIKTAEDLYEIIATTVPQAKFGVAFNEASGPCLIRTEGNDPELIEACTRNLQAVGAGHVFCVILKNAFPINVLNQIKNCPEVCRIFCATANPVEAVVAESSGASSALLTDFPPEASRGPKTRHTGKSFYERSDISSKENT